MTRHVLVARLDNDGDVLLAGPAVRAVAAGADGVTLLCGPRGRAAAKLLPGVDDIVTFHAGWIDPEPQPVTRADISALTDEIRAPIRHWSFFEICIRVRPPHELHRFSSIAFFV